MTDSTDQARAPGAPPGISDEARRFLSSPNPYAAGEPPEDRGDTEAWLRWIATRDERVTSMLAPRIPPDFSVERCAFELDGVRTHVFRPHHLPPTAPVYLDIHGGALIMGGGEACAVIGAASSTTRDMITWTVDYRMPPLHPYPTGLDDCVATYRRLLEERDPRHVVVGGSSAGGNLAAALVLRAKDEGLPMPAAVVLLSPEVDLTESGDTFRTHLELDHVLSPLMEVNLLYADGHDLAHPYLSPLFGDLAGFPPTFLQSGTRDLFLSNTVRMHRRLRAAGVHAELHVWEAMPHSGFGGAPEDAEVMTEVTGFLDRHLA